MDLGLAGRVTVITGASTGIGRAAALAVAAEGGRVAIGARRGDALEAVAEEIRGRGGDALAVPGDLVARAGVARLVDEAGARWGSVDALVACVGSTPLGGFDTLDDQMWQRAFETKFLASVRAVRAALPWFRKRGAGRAVLVVGNSAVSPSAGMVTSGAVNAALANVVAALARDLGPEGIGVVGVHPGPTDTARFEGLRALVARERGLAESAAADWVRTTIPTGRVGSPAEVGQLIAYLVSPLAAQLTGTSVVIDGGQTAGR